MATLNRAKRTGQDLCDVVMEPGQFSWTTTGIQRGEFGWNVTKKGRPVEKKAWQAAQYIARLALVTPDFTDGSTHYHEANLHPAWAVQKRFVGQWGAHRFYRLTRDIEYIRLREAERETARFGIELVAWSCFPKECEVEPPCREHEAKTNASTKGSGHCGRLWNRP
jgi:hypothetical protein